MTLIQKILRLLIPWLDLGAFKHDLTPQRERFIQQIKDKNS